MVSPGRGAAEQIKGDCRGGCTILLSNEDGCYSSATVRVAIKAETQRAQQQRPKR